MQKKLFSPRFLSRSLPISPYFFSSSSSTSPSSFLSPSSSVALYGISLACYNKALRLLYFPFSRRSGSSFFLGAFWLLISLSSISPWVHAHHIREQALRLCIRRHTSRVLGREEAFGGGCCSFFERIDEKDL